MEPVGCEREREIMEPVGCLGIIKLTTLVLRKDIKHFLGIAILWVIPYAFHRHMLLDLSSLALDALVQSLLSLYKLMISEAQVLAQSPAASLAPYNSTDPFVPKIHLSSFVPIIASFLFCMTISLISYSLLTFSVCRACLNKSVCFKGSLLGILSSVKNLVLTSMCVGAAAFGFISTAMTMMGIIAGVVLVVREIPIPMSGSTIPIAVTIAMSGLTVPIAVGGLYLAVLFSLACTAAVLEENTKGWGAMTRSMGLLNGRKRVALGLACVFYALVQPCEMWELWRWRGGEVVRVSWQAGIAVFGVAANVVLYMSCKRYKEEALDTLVAARAQFGRPEASLQGMDVETTLFLPTLQEKNERATPFGFARSIFDK